MRKTGSPACFFKVPTRSEPLWESFSPSEGQQDGPARGTRAMGVPDAEASLVACSTVDGRDGVPGRTPLYREVCELERRVRAVDHLTSLARLARGADAIDDEREKAFAREEPCLGRARELLEVSNNLASAETAVLAWEGVRAASSAAESGDADALAAAAETATRLETALRCVRHPHDPRRPPTSGALGEDEDDDARLTPATALDALHAAARALRAAAAMRGAPSSSEKETGPGRNPRRTQNRLLRETGDASAPPPSFSHLAPLVAETCGRWSRAHAAMGAELRGRNPLESRTEPSGDGGDGDGDDDETEVSETESAERIRRRRDVRRVGDRKSVFVIDAPSPWARRAAEACRVVTNAARCFLAATDAHGVALLPLLADLLDRTARAAGNFAAHQPRLWPKSRTLAQMCAARRDAEAVDDAVAACLRVLEEAHARLGEANAEAEAEEETSASGEDGEDVFFSSRGKGFVSRVALARALPVARRAAARSRAGAAALTEGIAACVRKACAEAYDTAPAGNWSSRKVLGMTRADRPPRSAACLPAVSRRRSSGVSSANLARDANETASSDADSDEARDGERDHVPDASEESVFDDVKAASAATRDVALARVLRPLFASLDRLGDGPFGNIARSVSVTAAGAAALEALLARVAAEGPGGVRCAGGGAERLEADVEALVGAVERERDGRAKQTKTSRAKGAESAAWRAAAKRARAVVAVARAAGSAASSAKGQAYANARAALGAEEAETWRRVCVK